MKYEEMLKRGREKLPESVFETQRFEIPKVKGHIEGSKTIVKNFLQIAQKLGRKAEHLLKYLLKELATPGNIKNGALVVGAKVPASRINEKIRQYANEFVFCKSCGKPDTKITQEGKLSFIKCLACGKKHPVKSKI